MKFIIPFVMSIVTVFTVVGCDATGKRTNGSKIAAEYDELKKMSVSQTKDTSSINTHADSIIKNSEEIKTETAAGTLTTDSVAKVSSLATDSKNSAVAIHESVANIQKDNATILHAAESLKNVEAEKQKLVAENTTLKQKVTDIAVKTQQESINKTQTMLRTFFGIGFAIILIGALLWVKGSGNLGMVVVGIGFLMVSIASAGIYYLDIMAKIGLFVFLGLFIPLIYFMIREVFNLDRSNKENVELIDKTKDYLPVESREKIFGALSQPVVIPLAQQIQSKDTQMRVRKIRKKKV
jgi:hypothetical protein